MFNFLAILLGNFQEKRNLLENHSFEAFHLIEELLLQADFVPSSTNSRSAAGVEIECALWVRSEQFTYSDCDSWFQHVLDPRTITLFSAGLSGSKMAIFCHWKSLKTLSAASERCCTQKNCYAPVHNLVCFCLFLMEVTRVEMDCFINVQPFNTARRCLKVMKAK